MNRRFGSVHDGMTFDLFVGGEEAPASLENEVEFIDAARLRREFSAWDGRLGSFHRKSGRRLSMGIARRLGERWAKHHAAKFGLEVSTFRDAFFFTLWTEVCTLVPVRHLARKLARRFPKVLFLIDFPPRQQTYLTFWYENDLEKYYLATELRKKGMRVAFFSKSPDFFRGNVLTFDAHPIWTRHARLSPPTLKSNECRATLDAGICGVRRMRELVGPSLNIEIPFCSAEEFDEPLLKKEGVMPQVRFSLHSSPIVEGAPASITAHTLIHFEEIELWRWLQTVLSERTRETRAASHEVIERHDVCEAHVCENFFFDTVIFAAEVRSRGGKVIAWPHSTNRGYDDIFYTSGMFDRINVVTQMAAERFSSILATNTDQRRLGPNAHAVECAKGGGLLPAVACCCHCRIPFFGSHACCPRAAACRSVQSPV